MEKATLIDYMRKAVACHHENSTVCLSKECHDCPHDYPVETIELVESALELLEEGKKHETD